MTLRREVQEYLAAQVDQLQSLQDAARAGDPEGVHGMRVAARRLRATLASCRPLLDHDPGATERTDAVRNELRWLGRLLGDVRDGQIQHGRLADRLDSVPGDLVLGPVRRRLDQEMDRRSRAALEKLRNALDDGRFRALTRSLAGLVEHPPLQSSADHPAEIALPGLVGHQVDRVRQKAASSNAARDPDGELHEVRKAAKRARYAAELATPAIGKPAKRLSRRMKGLQDALGEHQDAATARATLLELAVAADAAGENGFTYGLLLAEEDAAARAARSRYPKALRRATSRKATGWTTSR
jgi:CHAD domain-containing protein